MSTSASKSKYTLLNPRPEHFLQIQELCKRVYPFSKPWKLDQLESHRAYFPDGQLIVIQEETGSVVGMAFSLIISWDDYLSQDNWQDFTGSGYFHNHNPRKGKTLYGAEVMVDPLVRGQGIGKMLYEGRKKIVEKYGLKRIRAGARLRGYSKFSEKLSPNEYVKQVTENKIYDPTLSFQLNLGFKPLGVAANYLFNDPESLGYAAVIEWLNPKVATTRDLEKQRQSMTSFLEGHKFISVHLPRELQRLVRKSTLALGNVIKEYEGERFYNRVEFYREHLKKTRTSKKAPQLQNIFELLKSENKSVRLKLAHAFALQLELVNLCETSYRTWRQKLKPAYQSKKSKSLLTFVLTAHPSEARSKAIVDLSGQLEKILTNGVHSDFLINENELMNKLRMFWLSPLTKEESPNVIDEADYIYSIIFNEKIFDFILEDKSSYEIMLRTWVGGDKDGHPGVNKNVMKACFKKSRKYLLDIVTKKLQTIYNDAFLIQFRGVSSSELKGLLKLTTELEKLTLVAAGDGNRIKVWTMNYRRFLKSAGIFISRHSQITLISRLLEVFPAFVFPIELREDAALVQLGLTDTSSQIRGMLTELKSLAGSLGLNSYARGFIISHCESENDISNACSLVQVTSQGRTLPVIPLFESKAALSTSKKIIKNWLSNKNNLDLVKRHWAGYLEVMLGYSDSAKQVGSLPSRFLIGKAMADLEKTISSFNLKPHFFHGSGGSVARGGGSLKEQIAWWSDSAVAHPKLTVQGEMIQRQFATKEILDSQCIHLATESLKRKANSKKWESNAILEKFVSTVGREYSIVVDNPDLLNPLMEASPYQFLNLLKLGSRPSKRPSRVVSVENLRAIPWVLCWTQTRLLLPVWWGIGTAWKNLSVAEKEKLKLFCKSNPFLSSFVKTLGFSLAKVELDIWKLYFGKNPNHDLFQKVEKEFQDSVKFVYEISGERSLIWHRLWLEESIKLRSSSIHILNLLQIQALENGDEALLKETIVGIACGMLTTG